MGGIAFGTGVLGQGVDFPADAGKYLHRTVDDAVYDFGASEFTIALWVGFSSTVNEQVLIEKWVDCCGPGWTFTKDVDNRFVLSASGVPPLVSDIQSISLGVWHHLVVVRNGTTGTIYFDNFPIYSRSDFAGTIGNTSKPLLLGRRDGAELFPLRGSMDEVAVWSRALSSTEITDLYTAHQMICGCTTQPSGFAGGDGTPGNPYQVCSPLHLDNVRNHLSSHFIQTADINMTGVSFTTIGDIASKFSGVYSGERFNITNANIIQNGTHDYGGLFGYLASSGALNDIVLANMTVAGRNTVGGLVGRSEGNITNCFANGSINGSFDFIGGLVGYNTGTIARCLSLGDVHGRSRIGGLVGEMATGASIINSYSHSSATSSSGNAIGGLIGILRTGATVQNAYSTGFVAGLAPTGGLIGVNQGTSVQDSFWDQQTSGLSTSAGGFGKDTAQMQMQSTFTGWDFASDWTIDEGNDYPRLRQPAAPPPPAEANCADGIDNDCDGLIDCFDPDCAHDAVACPNGQIPAVSAWGMAVMSLLTITAATLILQRRA